MFPGSRLAGTVGAKCRADAGVSSWRACGVGQELDLPGDRKEVMQEKAK